MKVLLWLDDNRDPNENNWLSTSPIGAPFNVVWVKKYHEFVSWIEQNGLPDAICFDHDLSDIHCNKSTYKEKTGKDCANWLVDYCINNDLDLPLYSSHSSNSYGRENILGLLNNYKKFREKS